MSNDTTTNQDHANAFQAKLLEHISNNGVVLEHPAYFLDGLYEMGAEVLSQTSNIDTAQHPGSLNLFTGLGSEGSQILIDFLNDNIEAYFVWWELMGEYDHPVRDDTKVEFRFTLTLHAV